MPRPADHPHADALAKAVSVAGDLAAQSGSYPGIAWAAGVYELGGERRVYATSNEGMGYIPAGVRWDPWARLVFDPQGGLSDSLPWQGLADPARIVACHFLHLAQPCPALRLLAVASTAQIGPQAQDFFAERGISAAGHVPPMFAGGSGVHRVEAVIPKVLASTEAPGPAHRWNAALALLADAAALADLPRAYPEIHEAARAVEAGYGDRGRIASVEERMRALKLEAQPRRVSDDRLGPVTVGPQDESTVLPKGGVFAYATPFYAARVCAMVASMLRCRVMDEPLSGEGLADLLYEHCCVSENAATTSANSPGAWRDDHKEAGTNGLRC